MAGATETWIEAHEHLITCGFTLGLLVAGLGSACMAFLMVREMKRDRKFQEWVCLRGIYHSTHLVLTDLKCRPAASSGEEAVEREATMAGLVGFTEKLRQRIRDVETRYGLGGVDG